MKQKKHRKNPKPKREYGKNKYEKKPEQQKVEFKTNI